MKLARIALTLAAALFLASCALAAPEIVVLPAAPRPGEPLFVRASFPQGVARASCTWMKKQYDLVAAGDEYRAVVPVPAGAKPGGYHLDITQDLADGRQVQQSVLVQVQPRKFGVQHLRLSHTQESKYDASVTKREYGLIGKALDRVTPEWDLPGSFIMPIRGRVSTQFGLQRFVNGHFDYRHKGVDLAAPKGTPVKAAADGVVSLADDSFILHGQTIIIDHGAGVSSLYIHLSEIDVTPGQQVKQGEVIGRVGATGAATGPHLHYGVYVHHEAMDPFYWTKLPAL